MFWAEIWKISVFLSENFQFLEVKFSIYWNNVKQRERKALNLLNLLFQAVGGSASSTPTVVFCTASESLYAASALINLEACGAPCVSRVSDVMPWLSRVHASLNISSVSNGHTSSNADIFERELGGSLCTWKACCECEVLGSFFSPKKYLKSSSGLQY